jgi:sigma-B regulation protein RsbU (phosphoserine phosphatase)
MDPANAEAEEIQVRVELVPTRLVITITDSGVPFNPFGMNAHDVQASLEERDIGGLGIHLVRTLMDEVDYIRRAGHNVVTVTKRLETATST